MQKIFLKTVYSENGVFYFRFPMRGPGSLFLNTFVPSVSLRFPLALRAHFLSILFTCPLPSVSLFLNGARAHFSVSLSQYIRFPPFPFFINYHFSEFVTYFFTVIHIKNNNKVPKNTKYTVSSEHIDVLVGKRLGQFFSIFLPCPFTSVYLWRIFENDHSSEFFYLYTDIKQLSKGYLPSRKLYSGGGACARTKKINNLSMRSQNTYGAL